MEQLEIVCMKTTHAIQYDNGLTSFKTLGTNYIIFKSHPTGLELNAYRAEYSISGRVPYSDNGNPKSVLGINQNWIYGLKDPLTGTYPYRPENYK